VRRRPDRGAAAVEFALVAPILFLILFGIIDYGLWFADSIAVRQSSAEGARRASAWADGTTTPPWGKTPCGSWDAGTSAEIQALGCSIVANTDTLSGPVYVKIRILSGTLSSNVTGSGNWVAPNAVRICLMQDHQSISGFIPLPGHLVTSSVDMPIESFTGRTLPAGGETNLPSGANWDWCGPHA
jgi:hypothetical protein